MQYQYCDSYRLELRHRGKVEMKHQSVENAVVSRN